MNIIKEVRVALTDQTQHVLLKTLPKLHNLRTLLGELSFCLHIFLNLYTSDFYIIIIIMSKPVQHIITGMWQGHLFFFLYILDGPMDGNEIWDRGYNNIIHVGTSRPMFDVIIMG